MAQRPHDSPAVSIITIESFLTLLHKIPLPNQTHSTNDTDTIIQSSSLDEIMQEQDALIKLFSMVTRSAEYPTLATSTENFITKYMNEHNQFSGWFNQAFYFASIAHIAQHSKTSLESALLFTNSGLYVASGLEHLEIRLRLYLCRLYASAHLSYLHHVQKDYNHIADILLQLSTHRSDIDLKPYKAILAEIWTDSVVARVDTETAKDKEIADAVKFELITDLEQIKIYLSKKNYVAAKPLLEKITKQQDGLDRARRRTFFFNFAIFNMEALILTPSDNAEFSKTFDCTVSSLIKLLAECHDHVEIQIKFCKEIINSLDSSQSVEQRINTIELMRSILKEVRVRTRLPNFDSMLPDFFLKHKLERLRIPTLVPLVQLSPQKIMIQLKKILPQTILELPKNEIGKKIKKLTEYFSQTETKMAYDAAINQALNILSHIDHSNLYAEYFNEVYGIIVLSHLELEQFEMALHYTNVGICTKPKVDIELILRLCCMYALLHLNPENLIAHLKLEYDYLIDFLSKIQETKPDLNLTPYYKVLSAICPQPLIAAMQSLSYPIIDAEQVMQESYLKFALLHVRDEKPFQASLCFRRIIPEKLKFKSLQLYSFEYANFLVQHYLRARVQAQSPSITDVDEVIKAVLFALKMNFNWSGTEIKLYQSIITLFNSNIDKKQALKEMDKIMTQIIMKDGTIMYAFTLPRLVVTSELDQSAAIVSTAKQMPQPTTLSSTSITVSSTAKTVGPTNNSTINLPNPLQFIKKFGSFASRINIPPNLANLEKINQDTQNLILLLSDEKFTEVIAQGKKLLIEYDLYKNNCGLLDFICCCTALAHIGLKNFSPVLLHTSEGIYLNSSPENHTVLRLCRIYTLLNSNKFIDAEFERNYVVTTLFPTIEKSRLTTYKEILDSLWSNNVVKAVEIANKEHIQTSQQEQTSLTQAISSLKNHNYEQAAAYFIKIDTTKLSINDQRIFHLTYLENSMQLLFAKPGDGITDTQEYKDSIQKLINTLNVDYDWVTVQMNFCQTIIASIKQKNPKEKMRILSLFENVFDTLNLEKSIYYSELPKRTIKCEYEKIELEKNLSSPNLPTSANFVEQVITLPIPNGALSNFDKSMEFSQNIIEGNAALKKQFHSAKTAQEYRDVALEADSIIKFMNYSNRDSGCFNEAYYFAILAYLENNQYANALLFASEAIYINPTNNIRIFFYLCRIYTLLQLNNFTAAQCDYDALHKIFEGIETKLDLTPYKSVLDSLWSNFVLASIETDSQKNTRTVGQEQLILLNNAITYSNENNYEQATLCFAKINAAELNHSNQKKFHLERAILLTKKYMFESTLLQKQRLDLFITIKQELENLMFLDYNLKEQVTFADRIIQAFPSSIDLSKKKEHIQFAKKIFAILDKETAGYVSFLTIHAFDHEIDQLNTQIKNEKNIQAASPKDSAQANVTKNSKQAKGETLVTCTLPQLKNFMSQLHAVKLSAPLVHSEDVTQLIFSKIKEETDRLHKNFSNAKTPKYSNIIKAANKILNEHMNYSNHKRSGWFDEVYYCLTLAYMAQGKFEFVLYAASEGLQITDNPEITLCLHTAHLYASAALKYWTVVYTEYQFVENFLSKLQKNSTLTQYQTILNELWSSISKQATSVANKNITTAEQLLSLNNAIKCIDDEDYDTARSHLSLLNNTSGDHETTWRFRFTLAQFNMHMLLRNPVKSIDQAIPLVVSALDSVLKSHYEWSGILIKFCDTMIEFVNRTKDLNRKIEKIKLIKTVLEKLASKNPTYASRLCMLLLDHEIEKAETEKKNLSITTDGLTTTEDSTITLTTSVTTTTTTTATNTISTIPIVKEETTMESQKTSLTPAMKQNTDITLKEEKIEKMETQNEGSESKKNLDIERKEDPASIIATESSADNTISLTPAVAITTLNSSMTADKNQEQKPNVPVASIDTTTKNESIAKNSMSSPISSSITSDGLTTTEDSTITLTTSVTTTTTTTATNTISPIPIVKEETTMESQETSLTPAMKQNTDITLKEEKMETQNEGSESKENLDIEQKRDPASTIATESSADNTISLTPAVAITTLNSSMTADKNQEQKPNVPVASIDTTTKNDDVHESQNKEISIQTKKEEFNFKKQPYYYHEYEEAYTYFDQVNLDELDIEQQRLICFEAVKFNIQLLIISSNNPHIQVYNENYSTTVKMLEIFLSLYQNENFADIQIKFCKKLINYFSSDKFPEGQKIKNLELIKQILSDVTLINSKYSAQESISLLNSKIRKIKRNIVLTRNIPLSDFEYLYSLHRALFQNNFQLKIEDEFAAKLCISFYDLDDAETIAVHKIQLFIQLNQNNIPDSLAKLLQQFHFTFMGEQLCPAAPLPLNQFHYVGVTPCSRMLLELKVSDRRNVVIYKPIILNTGQAEFDAKSPHTVLLKTAHYTFTLAINPNKEEFIDACKNPTYSVGLPKFDIRLYEQYCVSVIYAQELYVACKTASNIPNVLKDLKNSLHLLLGLNFAQAYTFICTELFSLHFYGMLQNSQAKPFLQIFFSSLVDYYLTNEPFTKAKLFWSNYLMDSLKYNAPSFFKENLLFAEQFALFIDSFLQSQNDFTQFNVLCGNKMRAYIQKKQLNDLLVETKQAIQQVNTSPDNDNVPLIPTQEQNTQDRVPYGPLYIVVRPQNGVPADQHGAANADTATQNFANI